MLRMLCFWLGAAILSGPTALDALGQDSFDLPPIRYSESISKDPVALLERKIQRGELVLPQDPQFGVLPGLLKELNVPVESQAVAMDVSMNQALGRDSGYRSESKQRRIQSAASSLADAILMRNESPLEQVVQGTSSFAETFASQGPLDSQNRSLRQFDLQTRLFRHRLSYLIYTPEFQALPKEILVPLRAHLQETLRTDEYRAEREILEDTLPGWLSAS